MGVNDIEVTTADDAPKRATLKDFLKAGTYGRNVAAESAHLFGACADFVPEADEFQRELAFGESFGNVDEPPLGAPRIERLA